MSLNFEIKKVTVEDVLSIRAKVLWPNKPIAESMVVGDDQALHFAIIIKGEIVCVASLFVNGKKARLRKFATLEAFQNMGLGSKMLNFLLDYCRKQQLNYFWCDARCSAFEFYKKFGLEIDGEPFFKNGVEYYKMSRLLT